MIAYSESDGGISSDSSYSVVVKRGHTSDTTVDITSTRDSREPSCGSSSTCSTTTSSGTCSSKGKRLFHSEWQKSYTWLQFNEDEGKMYCSLCTKAKKRSVFVYPGCKRLRIDVIKEHASTKAHVAAAEEATLRNTTARCILKGIQSNNHALVNMFDVMYTIATEDLAISKFDSLSNLVERCGGPVLLAYRNGHSANEVLQCLARAIMHLLVNDINTAECFSLLIDESTDVSIHKQLVLYVVFPTPSGPSCQYLRIIQLVGGTAVTIHQAIVTEFNNLGINIKQMLGLATDGASVMVGRRNGVSTRLKENVPHLISIHCVAHRLALASVTAAECVPYISLYSSILKDIYNYLAHSSNRRAELEFWQSVYDDCTLTMKSPSPTRWLSMHNSVTSTAIAKTYLHSLK